MNIFSRILLFSLCILSFLFCTPPRFNRVIETGRLEPGQFETPGAPETRDQPETREAPGSTSQQPSEGSPFTSLNDTQLNRMAQQIFQNEAGGEREKLAYWSPNEDFPSLGIGHFIWFPQSASAARARFGGDSFPPFLRFAVAQGATLPPVLARLSPDFVCPWPNRRSFENMKSDDRASLVRFLDETKHLQMKHILQRFAGARSAFKAEPQGAAALARMDAVAGSPTGAYPIIDYVNFKGEGNSSDPSSWGLWNVLLQMKISFPEQAHLAFADAAAAVLRQRVERNPKDGVFLNGWLNRIQTYRDFRM